MATNSVGTGSSIIDVESIVTSLMQVERKRVTAVDAKIRAKDMEISAVGIFKSKASALEAALAGLETPSKVAPRAVTSSNADAVTAEATSEAALADVDVRVVTTASATRIVAGGFSSATVSIGEGTLNLDVGKYSTSGGTTNFTAKSNKTITLGAGATLTSLRDAINNADAGMKANIVETAGTFSLVVTGEDTGLDNAIRISSSGTQNLPGGGAPDLTSIAYSAATGETTAANVLQTARNAVVYLDGLRVERASNTISDAVPGVTFRLRKPADLADVSQATPVSISVSEQEGQFRTGLQAVVTAYNDFYKAYSTLFAPGGAGGGRGALSFDSALRSLANSVRDAMASGMSYTAADGSTKTLRFWQLGVEFQRDGTLKIDDTKLNSAIADGTADKVRSGVSLSAQSLLSDAISFAGEFETRSSTVKEAQKSLQDQKLKLEDKMTDLELSYRKRYAALDSTLQKLSGLNSSVQQILSQINAQKND